MAPGHPFYTRLNELLEGAGFDEFVEGLCARFYHARLGRPSLRPGVYFRALPVGYFEGIDSERGIAWRVADSLALRRFLLIGLDERTPDHSTISRTRRLIDIDTHREVFASVLGLLAEHGLLKGQRMGIDPRRLRQELTPTARGADRTQLRALLRDRRYATLPSAGAGEHSETAVGTRRSIQLEPDSAKTAGSGYAARAEKPRRAGVFATFALSAEPDDGRSANLAAYSPGSPPDSTHFSLPHISSSLAHSESFRHGLLGLPLGKPSTPSSLIFMNSTVPLTLALVSPTKCSSTRSGAERRKMYPVSAFTTIGLSPSSVNCTSFILSSVRERIQPSAAPGGCGGLIVLHITLESHDHHHHATTTRVFQKIVRVSK